MDKKRVKETLEYLEGIRFDEWEEVRDIVGVCFYKQQSKQAAEIRLELRKSERAKNRKE